MARNYYEILEVARTASEKDIRASYRRLARKYHPDVNQLDDRAEAKFKEINEAYQVLSKADSRKKYDRFGENWQYADQMNQGSGKSSFDWFNRARAHRQDFGFGNLGDFFGGSRARGFGDSTRTGRAEVPVKISLEEVYSGAKRMIQRPSDSLNGATGKQFQVRIPRGVETGSRIAITTDEGGTQTRLDLVVTVSRHRIFDRDGDDLRCGADAPLAAAILGGEIEVPTLDGKPVALSIPAETQNGRVFRLRGKGLPKRVGGGYGDLLVAVRVVLPTNLTNEQRLLFQQLQVIERTKD